MNDSLRRTEIRTLLLRVITGRCVPLIVAACLIVGCGGGEDLGKPVEVTGIVRMDGKHAAEVEVLFNRMEKGGSAEQRSFVAKTDAEGKFKIPAVYPTEYNVMIYDRKNENTDPNRIEAVDTGPYRKYGVDSILKAKVNSNQTEFTFDLDSK